MNVFRRQVLKYPSTPVGPGEIDPVVAIYFEFARAALTGILVRHDTIIMNQPEIAKLAWEQADQMMAEYTSRTGNTWPG